MQSQCSWKGSLLRTEHIQWCCLLLCFLIMKATTIHCQISHVNRISHKSIGSDGSYSTAVIDYNPVASFVRYPHLSPEVASTIINLNLDEYEKIVQNVSMNGGIDLVIFPEYTLFGPGIANRTKLRWFFEEVPNELPVENLCENVERPEQTVLGRASCIAKKFNTYLVLNMGDVQKCSGELNCPNDGMFLYNTNLAFDRKGNLIAKYHKTHLYFEEGINSGDGKPVYFTTDFGAKIGLLICFDIIFEQPLRQLIYGEKVDAIAYSTWWVNYPPFWNGLQFQQAVSYSYGIDLLAAGSGYTLLSSGSGIHLKGDSVGVYGTHRQGVTQIVKEQVVSKRSLMQHSPIITDIKKYTSDDNSTSIHPFIPEKGRSYNANVVAGSIVCNFAFTISPNSNITDNDPNNYFALVATDGKVFRPKFDQSSCTLMKCGSKSNCFTFIQWQLQISQSDVILSDLSIAMDRNKPQQTGTVDAFPMLVADGGKLYVDSIKESVKTNARADMPSSETIFVKNENNPRGFLGATLLVLTK